jgi:ribosomal protein S18 acetylase RimI-like enzyme
VLCVYNVAVTRNNIEIVEFNDSFAADFARLNYEWIEKYFAVERHDSEILDSPQKWVIEPGGQIFMALTGGKAVGTVALVPAGEGVLELTKMAVSPDFQGLGIGDGLMRRCVEFARERRIATIFLESHTKLTPALNLYRKFGFVEVPGDPNSLYSRADIRMELAISGDNL